MNFLQLDYIYKQRATALSAEITFGSWGRALWVTAANAYNKSEDKNEVVTDIHQSWGGGAPRTALGVSGDSDNVGFKLDIHSNGPDNLQQGDNAYIWVKPIDIVKLSAGRMDDITLRGDCVNGMWDWDRIGCVDGDEGWTFDGYFQNRGINVQVTPVEGLLIGAALPVQFENKDPDGKDSNRALGTVLSKGAAYLGAYTIEGIGTIKAAVKTEPKSGDKSHTKLGFAFDLTAVENLFVSVGAKTDTLEKTPKIVNAYARYNMEALTIHARVGTKISEKDTEKSKDDGAFGFLFGAGADYNLENGIGLFADVRYANGVWKKGSSASKSDCLTLGLGVTKGFSNGKVGVAFEGATNGYGRYQPNKDGDGFNWEIPVKFEYWF